MNDETEKTISFDSNTITQSEIRFNLLYEIGLILASLETMNEAAPRILETICRNLHFELGELWCLGKNETTLKLESVWHLPLPRLEKFVAESHQFEFPAGEGLPGKVLEQNAPVWIENLSGEANMPRRFFVEDTGLQSGFAFPILLGEKFLGAFSFFSTDVRRVDDALLQMFAAIGNSIGQFAKRESTESHLRASEDRYRAFIKQSTEGIWRFELNEKFSVKLPIEEQIKLSFERGYLAECNDAMARMYGLERAEELVGSRIADLLDMSDAANTAYIRAFIESGYNLTDAESHEKDAYGNDKYFLNTLVGTIENEYLVRVWGTQRDITEQKRAEQLLRESEENFRAFVQASSQAIWTTDTNGQNLEAFGWWETQTGHTREQSAGAGFLEAIHPNDRERIKEIWQNAVASVKSFEAECRIAKRNGDYQHFAIRGVPVFNTDNSFRQWIGTLTDISDRKLAEQALIDNEERYRALVEATSTVVWRANEQGELNFVGSFWEIVSGQRIDEILGSGWLDALHPEDREKTIKIWHKSLADKTIYETEFRVLTAEGEYRWFAVRGVPILNKDGTVREWVGANTDIHERKLAEQQLRESEERYRSLFETMDEGFCLCEMIFDADGKPFDYRFLEFNPVFEEMTGLVGARGKTALELLPNLEAHWFEIYGKVVLTGEAIRFTDGSEVMNRWFDVYAARVGSADSRKFMLLFNNITERKRAESALRESQAHLALALKIGRAGTFEWDIKNNINIWSPEIEAMYGIPIGTFENNFEGWRKRVEPEDAEVVESGMRHALQEKAADFEYEFRAILPDNSKRWFSGRARFEYDADGEPLRMIGINVDVTERKLTEIALSDARARLESTLTAGEIGTWIWNIAENAVIADKNLARMFSVSAADANGGKIEDYIRAIHAEDRGQVAAIIKQAIENGDFYEADYRLVSKNGDICWVVARGTIERDAGGKAVSLPGVVLDITERKKAEAERELLFIEAEKAREIAEQANHAKDEFIALVSHELRSPLNAMLGWTRILQNQKPDEKTRNYALDVIVRNARSQSRLIEDLLDIARVGKGKLRVEMQPTELIPIINAAVEIIKPTAETGNINFSQTLDRAADFITGDVDRLRQVIENLLSNAVKFTASGGDVEIRLERENSSAKIIVSDSGQGISEEFLPQIFERFKQADHSTTRRHGGLGIGLSLARDLVELHGGTISAQSAGENKGSTFIVTLPLRVVAPIKEDSSGGKFMDARGKLSGFWILAVDDEADARELVSFMLQINGAKVTTANSAVEALEILKNAEGKLPDVLLSDISMPNESGYALLEKIRALPLEHGGQIPAVALTAFNRPEDREAAFEAGFQKHLGKPVEPDDLISAIIETAGSKE